MIMTLAQLRGLEACAPQLEFFQRQFGTEVAVTRELCLEYASSFDWNWAASRLLSAPARCAYDEAVAPARCAYDEVVAATFADAANG